MHSPHKAGQYAAIIILITALSYVIYKAAVLVVNEDYVDSPVKWHTNTDIVIVSSHYNENLAWLRKSPYPVVVCSKKGANTPEISIDPKCTMDFNKGKEYTSYIKFIIEYYDNLPEFVVFLHGHENAWHQNMHILDAIRCAKKREYGYISLNNTIFPKLEWSTGNDGYDMLASLWENHFKQYLNMEMPEYFYHDCCAQFIVSRDRIRLRSKAAYRHWYNLVFQINNDYHLALAFEIVWPVIFGEQSDIRLERNQYKQSRFNCSLSDISPMQETPSMDKTYIVIMETGVKNSGLVATIPKSYSDYILIRQGASRDTYKLFDDGHIEVDLERDIKDYGFYVGVGMLIQAKAIPSTAWYLLLHNTCALRDQFTEKVETIMRDISWRIDIYWADRDGRCNISLQRRGAITHGANLFLESKYFDPIHLSELESGTHALSPKNFPVEQRYCREPSQSIAASALYFESFDVVNLN